MMNNQQEIVEQKKRLTALVLVYFEEGARGTNFYKDESFEGFSKDEVREMLRSLVNIGYLYRIDRKTTNGAGYGITSMGYDYLQQLRHENLADVETA